MKNQMDFTKGPIGKQILLFAIPMLIGNAVQQLYSLIDGIIVGQFIGGTALAAVGVSMGAGHFLIAAIIGFTTGASVVISQFFGAKDEANMKLTISTSIILLGGLSLLIGLLGFIFAPQFIHLLGAHEDIFADSVLYLRISLLGGVFLIFYNMYTAYLRALGDTKTPLYFLIASTILNIVLNVLFVIGFGFGVGSVAVGTVLSQAFAAIACFIYAQKNAPLLRINKLVFKIQHFKLILRYGIPAAVQLSIVTLANLTITRLLNSFGTAAVGGIIAATKVDSFAMLPLQNISMALTTFVGQNMGANLIDRAKKGLRSTWLMMIGFALSLSVLLTLFYPFLLRLFLDQTDAQAMEMLAIGGNYIQILVLFYFLFACLFSLVGFLRGAGDAVAAMVFPIISLTTRTVAAHVMILIFDMGPYALAWSIPIGWVLSSLIGFLYYRSGKWQGKTAVKHNTQNKNLKEAV